MDQSESDQRTSESDNDYQTLIIVVLIFNNHHDDNRTFRAWLLMIGDTVRHDQRRSELISACVL